MSKIVISYAKNGREAYEEVMKRAKDCIEETNPKLDTYFLINKLPKGTPEHSETPYAFKPYIFKEVFKRGYKQVIWIDSTIVTVKDLQPLFDYMKEHGVLAFDNLGHPLMNWISDVACQELNISEKELKDVKQIMACVVGFDINNEKGRKVFNEWYKQAERGESFRDNPSKRKGFIAHRHDQAVLSVLLHQNNISILDYGHLVYQPHDTNFEYGKYFYFINKAIENV